MSIFFRLRDGKVREFEQEEEEGKAGHWVGRRVDEGVGEWYGRRHE